MKDKILTIIEICAGVILAFGIGYAIFSYVVA